MQVSVLCKRMSFQYRAVGKFSSDPTHPTQSVSWSHGVTEAYQVRLSLRLWFWRQTCSAACQAGRWTGRQVLLDTDQRRPTYTPDKALVVGHGKDF